jgi:hypothetical protein
MTPAKLLTAVLAVACALFGAGLAVLVFFVPTEVLVDNEAETRPLPSVESLAQPPEVPDDGAFMEISQRPLFSDDRRPWEPPEVEAVVDATEEEQEQPLEELQVQLLGVVITPKTRLASLWNADTREVITLKVGDSLEGTLSEWSVAAIEPREVRFAARGGQARSVAEMEVFGGDLGRSRGNAVTNANPDTENIDPNNPEAEAEAELRRQAAERREEIRRRIAEARARRQAAQEESEN